MLADLLTILEHRPAGFEGMKLSFIGDCQNNMAYDLMRLACVMVTQQLSAKNSNPAREIAIQPPNSN